MGGVYAEHYGIEFSYNPFRDLLDILGLESLTTGHFGIRYSGLTVDYFGFRHSGTYA